MGDQEHGWVDKHSVGCYFCGVLFDEREGQNADEFNNGDGGSICPACLKEKVCGKCGSRKLDSLARGHGKGTVVCLDCDAHYWDGTWRTRAEWDLWVGGNGDAG